MQTGQDALLQLQDHAQGDAGAGGRVAESMVASHHHPHVTPWLGVPVSRCPSPAGGHPPLQRLAAPHEEGGEDVERCQEADALHPAEHGAQGSLAACSAEGARRPRSCRLWGGARISRRGKPAGNVSWCGTTPP